MGRALPAKSTWIDNVRRVIKHEHGKGWRVEQQSGRIKVTYVPGGASTKRKQAATTHLEWTASNATNLVTLVGEIRSRMESLHLGLGDAYALLDSRGTKSGGTNWEDVARRYEKWRLAPGIPKKTTYEREERHKIDKVINILGSTKKTPSTGKSLIERYTQLHLEKLKSGGDGRSKHLATVSRFLKFAVKHCGANPAWSPPDNEDIAALRGFKEEATKRTVPVKPEQLLALLESFEDKPEVRLAVALVGLYGLRPSELRTLEIVDGRLRATSTKRNLADARRGKSARLLLSLDLKELPGEGERVFKLFASGQTKLPNQIINARDNKSAGHAFGQYLRRNAVWQTFLEENPELTPYGLRHGYAWRGARYYDDPVVAEDLASLMGHEYPTHVKYYRQWTSDQDKIASVQRSTGNLNTKV